MSSKKKPSKPTIGKPDDIRLSRGRTRPEAIFPVAPPVSSLPESYASTLQEMSGLTTRNLLSMKIFAREFTNGPIAKQPVSQLPWGQIIRLMQMCEIGKA